MDEQKKRKGHLLIVDDEPDIVDVLSDILRPHVDQLSTAANGLDGLKIIKAGEIDALISDINMPKMSGLQMLAETRFAGLETPFVILTAYGERGNFQEAVRLDATDFIEKPFDPAEVVRVTGCALGLGMALKELDQSLHLIYENSLLPADEIARSKAFKRTIAMMRMKFSQLKRNSA